MTQPLPALSKRAFFKAIEYTPHKGQEQIHAACMDPNIKTVVVACGARFGKSMAAAAEMAWQAILPRADFMGWCVAPTHDLADIIFDLVGQYLRAFYKGNMRFDRNGGEIEVTNLSGGRSRILRRSTDRAQDTARLVGYAVDFLVLDEASAIEPDSIWDNQLSTRLIDRGGRTLMISTPRGTRGFFARLFRKGQTGQDPMIRAIRLPSWMNPHGHVRASMARERQLKDKRTFMQEYAAEFIAAEGLVFDPSDIEAISVGEFEDYDENCEYFGACDLAIRQDYTVLMIVRAARPDVKGDRAKIVYVKRMHRLPVEVQIEKIKEITDRYGQCSLYVDETGIGVPIVQQMLNADLFVRPVYWTHQEKSNMVKNALVLVERHVIVLPKPYLTPEFQEELAVYGWHGTGSSHADTARAPDGMNDDCVSAFIMACKWIRAGGTLSMDLSSEPSTEHRDVPRRPSNGPKLRQNLGRTEGFHIGGDAVPDGMGFTSSPQEGGRPRGGFGNSLFNGL